MELISKLNKIYTRDFIFLEKNDGERLSVVIPEVLNPTYGMYVWPCAPVLAQYIWFHKDLVKAKHVLEIGSGTALPGIVAAKCGAKVTLSDCSWDPACLENIQRSCKANDLADIDIVGITWGLYEPGLLQLPAVDIILGSDCFYDPKDFEDVLVTVSFVLTKNKNSQFWCSYQERSADRSIEQLLDRWNLGCTHIPLALFDADTPSIAGSELPGHHIIHMLIIENRSGNLGNFEK